MENKSLKFHEFEVKFRVDESKLNDWKIIMDEYKKDNPEYKGFVYVDSLDIYYTRPNSQVEGYEFVRYRFSENEKRAELTTKKKLTNSNNIIRKEYNIRVDGNKVEEIDEFINSLGFEYNFKIKKYVQIYVFKDATLPFYTVIDENGKRDTFLEIEVNESIIEKLTEEEAWDIIKKYEKLFERLGISSKNRLRKSLFDMYRRDK